MQIRGKKIKKKYILLFSLLALFFIGRATLPVFLLKKTNQYLSEFHPAYKLELKDLDISFLRGAYRFEKISGKLKDKSQKEFLHIDEVDVSVAWREIFRGKIVTDIIVENADFVVIKEIKKLSTPKDKTKEAKDTLFPLKIEKVELRNSSLTLDQYEDIDGKGKMRVSDINGFAENLKPDEKSPLSPFNLKAKILETSNVSFDGHLKLLEKPMSWDVDAVAKGVDLPKFNPILKDKLPLTITSGTLELYSEIKSKNGNVQGYVKPFMNNLDIIKNEGEDFKGVKHFGIEILTAVGNLILRDESKKRSIATKVDFTYDGKFKVNTGKAVTRALKHSFADEDDKEERKDKIKRGIENRLGETGGVDE